MGIVLAKGGGMGNIAGRRWAAAMRARQSPLSAACSSRHSPHLIRDQFRCRPAVPAVPLLHPNGQRGWDNPTQGERYRSLVFVTNVTSMSRHLSLDLERGGG